MSDGGASDARREQLDSRATAMSIDTLLEDASLGGNQQVVII
jgi:hypothetical protein